MKSLPQIFATIGILISLLCSVRSAAEAQRRPPNILVIVTDDMGYGDIGMHGSKHIPTGLRLPASHPEPLEAPQSDLSKIRRANDNHDSERHRAEHRLICHDGMFLKSLFSSSDI